MRFAFGISLFLSLFLFSCSKQPEACIQFSNSSISVGEEVTFTSCSKKSLSYIWSFEGPAGAPENDLQWSEPVFQRSFSVAGDYTVTLTAYERYSWLGQSNAVTETFTVN